jgi:hypothetical protein
VELSGLCVKPPGRLMMWGGPAWSSKGWKSKRLGKWSKCDGDGRTIMVSLCKRVMLTFRRKAGGKDSNSYSCGLFVMVIVGDSLRCPQVGGRGLPGWHVKLQQRRAPGVEHQTTFGDTVRLESLGENG